ncbi:MAG: rRNA maturation RNase YbeY [Bacteroidales bacterium]|nr:rRNA maturation RNase YbeY [Bacteroidales bacterium]
MASKINFFTEDIKYILRDKVAIRRWLMDAAFNEGCKIGEVNVIFCSDAYLSEHNQRYLKHSSLTDVITFDYSEGKTISGDIFISIERVCENAIKFKVSKNQELKRVMIHGLLHLCGYKDKTASERKTIRAKEDAYMLNVTLSAN